ncbi:MAG: hypothetical protein P8M30_07300 [Planctomycetaceae bacterium]|jgi:hypothetical protein|nr:hypothetical protein [Planctomycetaceae bacterium]
MSDWSSLCETLKGQEIVLDVTAMYVYLGTLTEWDDKFVTLETVDVHDLRDTETSRERYIVESRLHGIRPNRNRAHIRWDEIISLSAIEDVL